MKGEMYEQETKRNSLYWPPPWPLLRHCACCQCHAHMEDTCRRPTVSSGSNLYSLFTGRIFKINKTVKENRRALTLIAISGAFIFVISSLNPSVTGSCSHMTGTRLRGNSLRTGYRQRFGNHCPAVPGDPAGTRRTDHPRRQLPFLWQLPDPWYPSVSTLSAENARRTAESAYFWLPPSVIFLHTV